MDFPAIYLKKDRVKLSER